MHLHVYRSSAHGFISAIGTATKYYLFEYLGSICCALGQN